MKQLMKKKLLLIICCCACSACSTVPVKSWQKGTLASETMRFGGPNSMIKKFDEHIYTSKESSKGGGGVSGGGCGCN